eukprot:TRINITY_DN88355_c0_g1_i1.p1 TRINITY_DN88355_c0_g1~~TRINITY_DN88355_c0_g1_i1.p1  ORF type:complete len:278 (-),score=51.49 TRINITY_DN88355_c0_g1_i1:279-1112(-)
MAAGLVRRCLKSGEVTFQSAVLAGYASHGVRRLGTASPQVLSQLAPSGVLKAALNMRNPLLVTGKTQAGDPDGVAPDMAREIARRLNVNLELIPYSSPGELTDAVTKGEWALALVANEPARAKLIDFTAAYCEIEATYLVPPGSALASIQDVDGEGVRVAAVARGAYQLWLSDNLKHAKVLTAEGHPATFALFVDEKLDALAGLRDKLSAEALKLPGSRVLDGKFTSVLQSVGIPKGREASMAFLQELLEELKAGGFVEGLIEKHGVRGKLAVSAPA